MSMHNPSFPPSLWAAVTPAAPDFPSLQDDIEADVVVVGGGFTGLSTALHLAETGRRVVVLEAAAPGWGASGRNNGQVIPTLTRPDPDDIVARWGEAGERFVTLLRDSAADLFALAARHGIDCEAEQTGWIQPAHTPGRLRISERRFEQWRRHGASVALLDRDEVRRRVGSDLWHGGWTATTGGHINPLALARGLARVAAEKGAQIFAGSPVVAIGRQSDRWQARTERGTVTAHGLVLATNAYSGVFADTVAPALAREVVPVLSWQMATEPLDAAQRQTIVPGREAVSDTHGDLYFFRYDARNRLVTGGALIVPLAGADRLRRRIGARLARIFPQLGPVSFDFVWNGYIGMTRDYLPHLHRLGPNGYAWAGCNGRGVALSVAMGRELARAVTGTPERDLPMPIEPIRPIPFHGIARRLASMMLAVYRWRDNREI